MILIVTVPEAPASVSTPTRCDAGERLTVPVNVDFAAPATRVPDTAPVALTVPVTVENVLALLSCDCPVRVPPLEISNVADPVSPVDCTVQVPANAPPNGFGVGVDDSSPSDPDPNVDPYVFPVLRPMGSIDLSPGAS